MIPQEGPGLGHPEDAGRLRVPRLPVLCQHSAMLFTHERGSEASAAAANYPVLIFFGEKETRAFQTWPNLISWGRRGRARVAFPHWSSVREGPRVHGWLGHSQPLPPSWDKLVSGLHVSVLAVVPLLQEPGVLASGP